MCRSGNVTRRGVMTFSDVVLGGATNVFRPPDTTPERLDRLAEKPAESVLLICKADVDMNNVSVLHSCLYSLGYQGENRIQDRRRIVTIFIVQMFTCYARETIELNKKLRGFWAE